MCHIKNEIIFSYVFENENAAVSMCKRMLHYFLFPRQKGHPDDMIVLNDGAPPHYSLEVREFLNRKLPNRLMGRGGLIEWPSRSPDLTLCDCFFWGYIKGKVYREHSRTMTKIKTMIHQTIQIIDQGTLKNFSKI